MRTSVVPPRRRNVPRHARSERMEPAVTTITWPLTTATAPSLTVGNIQSMTSAQAATLTAATLNALSAPSFAAISAAQLKAIPVAAIAGLHAAQAANLTTAQIAALTPAQTAALTTADFASFGSAQFAALNAGSLTAAQVAALTPTAIAALTKTQAGQLTVAEIGALSAAQASALLASNACNLSTAQVAALKPAVVAGLSTAALAALSATQVNALTAAELNGFSSAQLQALNVSGLSATTLKSLTAATIGAMTGSEFASAVGANIAQLSTTQIKGITADEINALSGTQLAALTATQAAALTGAAATAYNALLSSLGGGSAVLSDFQSQVSGGAVGYNGLLKVLQDAATGGMTSGKLAALKQIAGELNAASGVSTSAYLAQAFNDVVNGNSANAKWTGGAATSTALGNLSASSTATQVNELIGKWFLGTDLPSWQALQGSSAIQGYQSYSLPLFGSSGAPQISDINQGSLGDCFFMSSLVTETEQDPSLIQNMIQSNGNGTYSVLFHVNGQDDYVTVNSQLLTFKNGYSAWDGTTMAFESSPNDMWASLIEKGYAELMGQTGVTTYSGKGNIDSFAAMNGGDSNGLSAITGQSVTENSIGSTTSASALQSDITNAAAAFNAHEGVMFGTGSNHSGNFVQDHMFAVTGIDAVADTVTLHNPWGDAACSAAHLQATFTVSLAQLKAEGGTLEYAIGTPAAA